MFALRMNPCTREKLLLKGFFWHLLETKVMLKSWEMECFNLGEVVNGFFIHFFLCTRLRFLHMPNACFFWVKTSICQKSQILGDQVVSTITQFFKILSTWFLPLTRKRKDKNAYTINHMTKASDTTEMVVLTTGPWTNTLFYVLFQKDLNSWQNSNVENLR